MDEAFRKSGVGVPEHDGADSPESRFLGLPITRVPELVRLACPCTYVDQNTPPFYILHGSADQTVPVEQSMTLYRTICEKAGPDRAVLRIAEGKPHHGDLWFHEPEVVEPCLDFLDTVLKRKEEKK
ncbi:MAG: prolyl oligopeptidase family serine peptidase, partial [Otoolea sp.]